MKVSWGTAIVMAIMSFMAFILYFVITMSTSDLYSHDLVTEEYYKTELEFQGQLDKEMNASLLPNNIKVLKTAEGLLITFPKELEYDSIKGTVFLYRPSDKQLDSEIPISLSSHQLLVPDRNLLGGRWNIIIDWQYEEESYYFKEEIIF